ncbi:hypothetical protein BC834DRAFT_560138 [Gloeopeniophorella convolvens]|nr:hypothetical protein BC834DRAFT_560138 [Gloeopeniophorella convolvens]
MTTSLRTSHSTAARGKGARLSCPSIKDLSLNPTQERPSRPSRPLSERVSNSLRVLVEPGRLSPRARKQSLQDFPDSYSCPRDQSPDAQYSTSCVPAPLDYEQELSQIDSAGSLFLAKTLPDLPPSSIIWDSPGWGDWAPHDFTHCIYSSRRKRP